MTGKELRTYRQRVGLTQGSLAEQLDVGRNTVWGWETGKTPISRMSAVAIKAAVLNRTSELLHAAVREVEPHDPVLADSLMRDGVITGPKVTRLSLLCAQTSRMKRPPAPRYRHWQILGPDGLPVYCGDSLGTAPPKMLESWGPGHTWRQIDKSVCPYCEAMKHAMGRTYVS